jgi:hypothetical protein
MVTVSTLSWEEVAEPTFGAARAARRDALGITMVAVEELGD